jgi:hypothetical protein
MMHTGTMVLYEQDYIYENARGLVPWYFLCHIICSNVYDMVVQ